MPEQQDWALSEPKDGASALFANPSPGQKLHGLQAFQVKRVGPALSLQDGSEGRVQGPSHTHLPGSELEGEGRWKGESSLDYPRTGGGWETEALGVRM